MPAAGPDITPILQALAGLQEALRSTYGDRYQLAVRLPDLVICDGIDGALDRVSPTGLREDRSPAASPNPPIIGPVLAGGIPVRPSIQGWPLVREDKHAIYIRIPSDLARPIEGGCGCQYCTDHPSETPSWDTLGVPKPEHGGRLVTWTLHAPEWELEEL